MPIQNITTKYDIQDSDLDKLDAKFDGLISKNKALEKQVSDVSKEFTTAAKSADKFGDEANEASKKATEGLKNAERQGGILGNSFKSLGGILAGVFVVDKILEFGKKMVDLAASTQRTAGILANQLGSQSAAQKALLQLNQLSRDAKIPLDTLTDAYMKLIARGIKPTSKELIVFSDIANSVGKSIDQLIEAVLDAQTGEFERLKEFGIKARVEGENVKFMFKDVETTVSNTSDAIKDYLIGLGDIQGVSGATAAATQGINEELIRFDNNLGAIGKKLAGQDGIFTKGLGLFNDYLDKIIISMTSLEDLKLEKVSKQTQEYLDIVGESKSLQEFTEEDYIKNKIKEFEVLQQQTLAKQKKIKKESDEVGFINLTGRNFNDEIDNQKNIYSQTEVQIKSLREALLVVIQDQEKFLNPKAPKSNTKKGKGGKGPKESPLALPNLNVDDIKEAEAPFDILIKHYDDVVKKSTDTADKSLEYYSKMYGIEMPQVVDKFTEAELAAMDKRREYFEAQEAAKLEYRKAVEEEAMNFAISSANAYMDFRAQQLSDEQGMLSAMREADLVLAGDNEQAKHDIEIQYAEKERELRRKQAVNDRNQALFNIAVNTAQGIMSVLSTGGGTRYADFGISAGILTALVAATGAVQAGLVLARPLPQFFKGTDSSPEGLAWVGERGAEGKITPDGRFSLIPGGAHIDYLQRGTKIIPNHRLDDFMNTEMVHPNMSVSDTYNSGINIKALGAEIGSQLSRVTVQQDIYDEKGYRSFVRSQNQRKERLERKNRFNRSL